MHAESLTDYRVQEWEGVDVRWVRKSRETTITIRYRRKWVMEWRVECREFATEVLLYLWSPRELPHYIRECNSRGLVACNEVVEKFRGDGEVDWAGVGRSLQRMAE